MTDEPYEAVRGWFPGACEEALALAASVLADVSRQRGTTPVNAAIKLVCRLEALEVGGSEHASELLDAFLKENL